MVHLCRWSAGEPSKDLDQVNVKVVQFVDIRVHEKAVKWSNECNFMASLFSKFDMNFELSDFFIKTEKDKERQKGDQHRDRILAIINKILKFGYMRRDIQARLEADLQNIENLRSEKEKLKRQSERAIAKHRETLARKAAESADHTLLLEEEK